MNAESIIEQYEPFHMKEARLIEYDAGNNAWLLKMLCDRVDSLMLIVSEQQKQIAFLTKRTIMKD